MAKVVEVRDLHYRYPDGVEALKGVSFEVEEGESVGIVGPNGAGKSTLLLHLNGILLGYSPSGSDPVRIKGIPVRRETLSQIRRLVGLVFQDPNDQLFSPTVFDDVAFGPLNMGLPPEEVVERVKRALQAVGMAGYENRSPHHLSFGEKKRVAIATVLAMAPEILVLDEPTANLDPVGRWELMELLRSLPHTRVIASHDLDFVEKMCDKVVVLNSGKVLACGPASQILKDRSLLTRARLFPAL